MGILKPIENTMAFLKAGFFGFEGSGKTTSAALLAIGLHQHINSKKSIAMFDTETGSSFIKPLFDYAKIKFIGIQSRSLKDLKTTIDEAEKECDILIVDSLTHPYQELCSTYVKKKRDGTNFIRMQDWQPIKDTWRINFSTPYVNSNLHIIWCSRAKNIFEEVLDEVASNQANKEIYKPIQTGTGARSETESAYEPSILVEFTREYRTEDAKETKKTGKYRRKATVVKDRAIILDGQEAFFETTIINKNGNPIINYKDLIENNKVFKFFSPHIQLLNLGGKHLGYKDSTSDTLFDGGDKDVVVMRKRRDIALEKIENGLASLWPAHQGKDKQLKLSALDILTGSSSWTEIKGLNPDVLEKAVTIIQIVKDETLKGNGVETETELRNWLSDLKKKTIMTSQKVLKDNGNDGGLFNEQNP